jgi:dGTPase
MKDWSSCISYRRFGYQPSTSQYLRSEFTRDYDRIIFLSAFRRLQDKTQVFPLPGNVFVHNRLTHSLEVASVGRSLGLIAGNRIASELQNELSAEAIAFYQYELSGVIASACLAHDVGNPAFGHSGEKAISHYFEANAYRQINGKSLKAHFSELEWEDLIQFEGNANALRLLTHHFQGRLPGGHTLMMVTLASILKYPCAAHEVDKSWIHRKKFGYFQSDKPAFDSIIDEFNLRQSDGSIIRHPFVYLVEAADDICYRIIDMEDAHRIGILYRDQIEYYFIKLLRELDINTTRTEEVVRKITDDNEAVSFLRAKCIHALVNTSTDIFFKHKDDILTGNFNSSLMDEVNKSCTTLADIEKISIQKIYNHPSVIEVELAGYNVMSEILSIFVEAMITDKKTTMQKKSLMLIPQQYNLATAETSYYEKTMGVLDFVSGMTDGYATEMYRRVKGIEIPAHK